jgi:cell division protein FtsN
MTQAMFEPAAPSATMLASATRQVAPAAPSADSSDPIDVVLTRSTNAPPQLTVSGSMAAAQAPRPTGGFSQDYGNRSVAVAPQRPARVREAHNWVVQVGAYRSEREAMKQVERMANRFASLGSAEGSVASGGGQYRARFAGFTEASARQACDAVKAKDIPCIASGPR